MKMTGAHVERYVEEGYVVVEGGLTDADLEPVIQDYTDIVDGIARKLHSQGRISSLYEGETFETRLARIADEEGGCHFHSQADPPWILRE